MACVGRHEQSRVPNVQGLEWLVRVDRFAFDCVGGEGEGGEAGVVEGEEDVDRVEFFYEADFSCGVEAEWAERGLSSRVYCEDCAVRETGYVLNFGYYLIK